MTDPTGPAPDDKQPEEPATGAPARRTARTPPNPDGRQFHGWRLLGVIFLVILAIAIVSAIVDWWVIGPLEGRAPWL